MRRPKKRVPVLDQELCWTLFKSHRADGIGNISKVTGISYSAIWRYLARERIPSVKAFRKLARAFNLTMEELYDLLYPNKTRRAA